MRLALNQIIRIEEWAWQITTAADAIQDDDYTTIELRELDYLERTAIPLFAIATEQSQSELPMPELANEYATSEGERERLQELMERMEQRRMSGVEPTRKTLSKRVNGRIVTPAKIILM
jgi:hypothetical protein